MQDQPWRLFMGLGPAGTAGDGIGIAVERVDGCPGIEQAPGISAGTERGIDHHRAGFRSKRADHFIQQHRDVRGPLALSLSRGHLRPFALAASAESIAQAA